MGKVPRGLPKSYIKKWGISKLAWKKFRAGALTKGVRTRTRAIKRRIRRSRRKPRHNPRKKVRRLVRRRKRRRSSKSITRTAFKFIRLGALVGPGVYAFSQQSDPMKGATSALLGYGGMDYRGKDFSWNRLGQFWAPYLATCAATYGIPKLISIIRRL